MGLTKRCVVHWGRKRSEGRALLETHELIFRGDFRLVIPFKGIRSLAVEDGTLRVMFAHGVASFELGPRAAQWAQKIHNPKSLIDKLGVKPDSIVGVMRVRDPSFLSQLRMRTDRVSEGRVLKSSDLIFLGVEKPADLKRLPAVLAATIRPERAIWVIWPKGQPRVREDDIRGAAFAAGLVDVKVVAFSPTHSGLKLVIPLAKRPKRGA